MFLAKLLSKWGNMKKSLALLAAATLLFSAISVVAPAEAATKYSSCTSLNKKYPSGVARTASAASKLDSKYAKPKVSKSVYDANKKLDKKKSLVICPVVKKQTTDAYSSKWGTFETLTYSGFGDDVIELDKALASGIAEYSYTGSSNFIAIGYSSDMNMNDLMANEIGSVSGSTLFGVGYFKSDKTKFIEVTASGDWTITLKPVSKAANFSGSGSGTGVYKGNIKAGKKTITYDGESNFIVYQWCTNGTSDLLANEIGSYRGSKLVKGGSCLIAVQSEGTWSIK
jgi:hypothetical protein